MKRLLPPFLPLSLPLCVAALFSVAAALPTLHDTVSFNGHFGGVNWIDLSADGQSVFTQGGNTVIEWDALTGQRKRIAQPLGEQPFMPLYWRNLYRYDMATAKLLVIYNKAEQPRLSLINLKSGQVEVTFRVKWHSLEVVWGKGQQAVAVRDEGTGAGLLWFWREGMMAPKAIPCGEGECRNFAFSLDHTLLYVLDDQLKTYSCVSGKLLRASSSAPSRSRPFSTHWSSDKPLLESSPYSPRLLVRTEEGLALLHSQNLRLLGYLAPEFDDVEQVRWSPDGQRLTLTVDGYTHVVDAQSGKTLGIVDGTGVLSQPDAQTIWTKGPGYFLLSEIRRGLNLTTIESGLTEDAPVAVDPSGRPTRWITHRQAEGGRETAQNAITTPKGSLPLDEHFTQRARFTPDGQQWASLSSNQLWLLGTKTHRKALTLDVPYSRDFAFSPNRRLLAVSGDQTRLFDAHSGKLLRVLKDAGKEPYVPNGTNLALAFSPDGKRLAVGYEAHAIGLWDVQTGKLTKVLDNGKNWVLSVAFSPDGQTLAVGGGDGSVNFYDVPSGRKSATPRAHRAFVRAVAFSPSGDQVAAASGDGSVSLWSAKGKTKGKLLRRLTEHAGAATALAYLDAQTLVSGDSRGTLRGWNPANGQLLNKFGRAQGLIQSLQLSPDGRKLLSSDRDNALRVYKVKR